MDRYKKLKAVQGLVQSLDEQIYRMDNLKEAVPKVAYASVTDEYYKAIKELLNEST